MTPWKTLATVPTADGPLELRQRGAKDFLIVIDGRVLMTSRERRSEEAVAKLACGPIADRPKPRVLIGGLGMGYTLRAALDALPPRAEVVVAELTPVVEEWCKGPMALLTKDACRDKRVKIVIGDVARVIADAPRGRYDAIILDLYEGPNAQTQDDRDPFYGRAALARTYDALAEDGIFSIWAEEYDAPFKKRFEANGYKVWVEKIGSTRTHSVYIGTKLPPLGQGRGGKPGGGARPTRGEGRSGGRR